jgi:tetratricopeptide (TPR) repeat protein
VRALLPLLLLSLLLAGCGALPPTSEVPTEARVTALLERQDFLAARRLLEPASQGPQAAAAKRQLERVVKAERAYEKATLAELDKLTKAAEWNAAEDLLATARGRIPSSAALARADEGLRHARRHVIEHLEARRLLVEFRYLREQVALNREAAQLDAPGPFASWSARRVEQRLGELAAELETHAGVMEEHGRAQLAREMRQAARDPAVATVGTTRSRAGRAAPPLDTLAPIEAAERRREVARTVQQGSAALEAGDLRLALQRAYQATAQDPADPEAAALLTAAERALASEVERLDNQAQRLYRRGRVAEARGAWLELLELDPDNPSAKAAIERAERVLGNLERLREER